MSPESRLQELKLELPPAPKAMGLYKPVIVVGNLAYLSGHGPLQADGSLVTGKVGADVDQQTAVNAARQTGLAMLATLRAHLGTLDRVVRLVKLFGMVNCTAEFTQQPAVINGCSELFHDIWGADAGVGARSAIGTISLPGNMTTEIEGIFELRPS